MNAFLLPLLLGLSLGASGAEESPVVAGAWTELRQAPLFDSDPVPLAKVWGPSLPVGNGFRIEKIYGRWLFGIPEPNPRMSAKERAKPGWIYSRMLLVPGDKDTASPSTMKRARAMIYHSRNAWRELGLARDPLFARLDFLESLVLSERTLAAFQKQDEAPLALPSIIPEAHAEETGDSDLGLTGTDLGFLDQEFQVLQTRKVKTEKRKQAQRAHAPKFPPLDDSARNSILGRFMLRKYFDFPQFSHEELDGYVYMKAAATRALRGCPKPVRDFWAGRPWNFLRVYRLKSRPEEKHPWMQYRLPGGYFAVSGRAIDIAGNEAELAFLLVRALVEETRLKRRQPSFPKRGWPKTLEALSEEQWEKSLHAQSTKDGDAVDVAHDIAVDAAAVECISRAGYRPIAALSYLRRLSARRDEPWSKRFFDENPGLDYRLDRSAALVEDGLSKRRFPEGKSSNVKRFATASRHWNLLP